MSNPRDLLDQVLLDLGLEDLIPTAEAATNPEVLAAVVDVELIPALSRSLKRLVGLGQLRVYRGHWHADAQPLPDDEAQKLLENPAWYSFHLDDPNEERLCFINVENLRKD